MRSPFRQRWRTNPFAISVATTFLGALLGWLLAVLGSPSFLHDPIGRQQIARQLRPTHLFLTNAGVLSVLVFGGMLVGLPTLVALFQNGLVLGILAGTAFRNGEFMVFLALTVPHGVFELPAFWIGGGIGLGLPMDFVRYLRGGHGSPITRQDVARNGSRLLLAVLLVAIAAVVESTVTVRIAKHL